MRTYLIVIRDSGEKWGRSKAVGTTALKLSFEGIHDVMSSLFRNLTTDHFDSHFSCLSLKSIWNSNPAANHPFNLLQG